MGLGTINVSSPICPSCGEFVATLFELTGWCAKCSGSTGDECTSCGSLFSKDTPTRTTCPRCREKRWEEDNADAIERWIGAGLPYKLALDRVRFENRPTCVVCLNKIKMGTKGRHFFCTTTEQCEKGSKKFKILKRKHYKTHTSTQIVGMVLIWLQSNNSSQNLGN